MRYIALGFFVAACGGGQTQPSGPTQTPLQTPGGETLTKVEKTAAELFPLEAQAKAGVNNAELAGILVAHWDWTMQEAPVWATTLGDRRFDDRLGDNSSEALMRQRNERDGFAAAAAQIDESSLSATDRTTRALFMGRLAARKAMDVCEAHLWEVSARGNPITQFNVLPMNHRVVTFRDAENLLSRYRMIPGVIDTHIAQLRQGAAKGLVANAESLRRTLELAEGQLKKNLADWALLKPTQGEYADWSSQQRQRFSKELNEVVKSEVKPAYERYRDLLTTLVEQGRGPEKVGVGALPVGKACYEARLAFFTGLPKTAEALHQTGTNEIARINGEMAQLGGKLFKTKKLAKVVERLRTDQSLYFTKKEDIVAAAQTALAKARKVMPEYFGILPQSECVVTEIPDYEAPYTTIAYYRMPHADGTKPGEYFINTYKPEVRPRFEMEVLAYHEAIPGHHLQIAIAQEREEMPAFRRFGGSTAFVEGWALYTERLSQEMGLYSGDLDIMGMLSYDAWRAARLVVDTGIHAKGWTRTQAEEYMLRHTALTPENIRNEVDRYISWPGQAVAYKTGQLEIFRLRAMAEKALGKRFDIKKFHDVVLRSGAVTLPVLANAVEQYISINK